MVVFIGVADPPDDAVRREDDLGLAGRSVAEQLTLGLYKHITVLLQLEAIHAARIHAVVQHCNKNIIIKYLYCSSQYCERKIVFSYTIVADT